VIDMCSYFSTLCSNIAFFYQIGYLGLDIVPWYAHLLGQIFSIENLERIGTLLIENLKDFFPLFIGHLSLPLL